MTPANTPERATDTHYSALHTHLVMADKAATSLIDALLPLADLYPIAGSHEDASKALDVASFKAVPTAVVPPWGMFTPLTENKHRFLLAKDGLHIEVRRPWLHLIHRLHEETSITMPFGEVTPRIDLAFGRLGVALDLMRAFVRDAKNELPNEHVRHFAWDEQAQQLVPVDLQIEAATPGAVQYRTPDLPEHQSLAIDIHSHGSLPAFFSDEDNKDDAGSVKFSGVIGNLDTSTPSLEFRLCVLGLYLPVLVPADKLFGG